nr:unnamed protein product [Callosobruchus chinensis]
MRTHTGEKSHVCDICHKGEEVHVSKRTWKRSIIRRKIKAPKGVSNNSSMNFRRTKSAFSKMEHTISYQIFQFFL